MEVHVKLLRMREKRRQCHGMAHEVRVRHERAFLRKGQVPVGQIEIRSDGRAQPPDDRASCRAAIQMMDMTEAHALTALVIDGDVRVDGSALVNLDLRMTL